MMEMRDYLQKSHLDIARAKKLWRFLYHREQRESFRIINNRRYRVKDFSHFFFVTCSRTITLTNINAIVTSYTKGSMRRKIIPIFFQ